MQHIVGKIDVSFFSLHLSSDFVRKYDEFITEAEEQDLPFLRRLIGTARIGGPPDLDAVTMRKLEWTLSESPDPDYTFLPEGTPETGEQRNVYLVYDGTFASLEVDGPMARSIPLRWAEELEYIRRLRRLGYLPLSGETCKLDEFAALAGGQTVCGADWHAHTTWVPLSVFLYFRLARRMGLNPEDARKFSSNTVTSLAQRYLAMPDRNGTLERLCLEFLGQLDVTGDDDFVAVTTYEFMDLGTDLNAYTRVREKMRDALAGTGDDPDFKVGARAMVEGAADHTLKIYVVGPDENEHSGFN